MPNETTDDLPSGDDFLPEGRAEIDRIIAGVKEDTERRQTTDPLAGEIEIEPYPPRQIGGQHVGTGPNGIKLTHVPSGLIAIADSDRSQHRNRAIAMDMIMGGLTSPHYRGSR